MYDQVWFYFTARYSLAKKLPKGAGQMYVTTRTPAGAALQPKYAGMCGHWLLGIALRFVLRVMLANPFSCPTCRCCHTVQVSTRRVHRNQHLYLAPSSSVLIVSTSQPMSQQYYIIEWPWLCRQLFDCSCMLNYLNKTMRGAAI